MKTLKKILYWLTILPPVYDVFLGTFKGLCNIVKLAKEMEKNKDIEQFLKDNYNE